MKMKYLISISLLLVGVLPAFAQVSNDNEDGVNKIDVRLSRQDFVPGQVLMKFKDSNRVQVRHAGGQFASVSLGHVSAVLKNHGVEQMEQLLPNENPNRKLARARSYNGDIIEERDLSQLYLLTLSEAHQQETMQIVNELSAIDEVEYAEPNYYAYIMGEETIAESYSANPMVRQQWYLDAYGVSELWDKPIINPERPVIAVIDTGVDTTHPDLKDNCIEGYDFINDTPNVMDDNMHGTHVAGIAAACNNETGIIGANPKALIMPIKVMDMNGRGNTATILKGVNYAVEHGAKILNLSLGGYGYSKAEADVYRNASLKAVIVAAAGNDGRCIYNTHSGLLKHGIQPGPSFPAAYSFVLGVQATDRTGALASFSNYDDDGPLYSCEASLDEPDGFNYELKAPGTEILSTVPNGQYTILQGTSMASPLVAGAISALMMVKQYDSQERLWAEFLHSKNILEAYELKELPADLDVVRIMLRQRKEFSDETEEAYSGVNEVKAGETVNIYPVVRCTSGEASDIKVKLGFDDNEDPNIVQIVTGEADFGWHLDALGKAVSMNPLVIKIPETIADSRHIRMKLTVSCDNQKGKNFRSFTFLANNIETISGAISENTTLKAGHTYYVNDNIGVSKGVTLTIEPGTRLEFADNKKLNCSGKLVAKGTSENPIIFTSHLGNGTWDGILTREFSGIQHHSGLYTNGDSTLFTIYPTDATPIDMSRGFRKTPYYDPSAGVEDNKTFRLEDYLEDWDENEDFVGKEALLTDPNYITPAVLRMLEDFKSYCVKFGSGERSDTRTRWVDIKALPLSWTTYEDYGDTIAYCRIENCQIPSGGGIDPFTSPYMENCVITKCYYRDAIDKMRGIKTVLTENVGYDYKRERKPNQRYYNIINNSHPIYESGYGSRNLPQYSDLIECNYFNNPAKLPTWTDSGKYKDVEYWLQTGASEPEVDYSYHPSYLGTSREDIVRPHIYELGNAPGAIWGVIDLSNMRTTPVAEAHGIVWKVVVNGKDAQDEYEDLAPLGVGRHKFEVYFNRPMNKSVIPQVSFGLRDPWTQNPVDEDGSWNSDGTIYTVYKTITGKTASDGVNRIYVRGAEDNEYFPCPYEKSRFNVNIQAAGSMATGFAAEAGLGNVSLTWNNENNDFEDAMGFNIYRICDKVTKTIPGYRDENWQWHEPSVVPDTVRINDGILDIETTKFIDDQVTPGTTYYYLYKVLSTDLKEYDISNIVAATPMTATRGDANGDGDVNVLDVMTTVNYILEAKPTPFVFEAADMNTDTFIDVLDVVGITQKILHPNATRAANSEQTAEAVYTIGNDGMLYIETPVALAGLQLQLRSDEKVSMASELDGFEQAGAWLSDNDYRLLVYQMGDKQLLPGRHPIMMVGDADITSIRLSDAQGRLVRVVAGDGTTQIKDVMGAKMINGKGVYNLKGQKVSANTENLKHGVYIINGKKVVK